MAIGDNIKLWRERRNLKQSELAQELGVSDKTVSSWEINRTEPKMGMIEKISLVLDCRKTDIIGADKNDIDYIVQLDSGEKVIIECYRKLPHDSQNKLKKYAAMLANICDLEEPVLKAAHERTDIKVTDKMRKHDDKIMDSDDF